MALAGKRCRWADAGTVAVLMTAVTLSTVGVIWNINFFTQGGSLAAPLLENFDMELDWRHAMEYLDRRPITDPLHWRMFSWLIIAECAVFGQNIAVPLMFNVLFYGLALTAMGEVAYLATDDRRAARFTVITGACMCYLMAQSMTLLKDVPVTLLMAIAALLMLGWNRRGGWPRAWSAAAMVLVIVLSTFLRSTAGFMIAIGAVFFLFYTRDRRLQAAYIGVALISIVCFFWLPLNIISTNLQEVLENPTQSHMIFDHDNTRAWDVMMGSGEDGENLTLLRRLIWWPAAVVVQFLVPFPWNFLYHTNYGPSMALAHVAYPWYLAGALIIYWLWTCAWRAPVRLRAIVNWGVALTLITAFATTGRISRYCLPFLPLLLPAAGAVLAGCLRRRSLWIWLGVFVALMIPTLIICHHLQGRFMS